MATPDHTTVYLGALVRLSACLSSLTTQRAVTGGSRGLGFGLVTLLAERVNALVFATARDPTRANELRELATKHENVIPVQLELTSEKSVEALTRFIEEKAGRLHVAINNAGARVSPLSESACMS